MPNIMDPQNRIRNDNHPQINFRSQTRRTLVPANTTPNAKLGLVAVGGYRDEHGLTYNFRFIGGQITELVSVYRMPVLSRSGAPFNRFGMKILHNIALLIQRLYSMTEINLPELHPLNPNVREHAEVYDNYELFRSLMDRIQFKSGYDLRKYFEIDSWGPIIRGIYENFERQIAATPTGERIEKFYVPSFCDYKGEEILIAGTTRLEDGCEVYISPPSNSYSTVSRVVYTKAGWMALCNVLGYSDIGAALLWEEIYHLYGNKTDITLESVLDYIAAEGFAPCMAEDTNVHLGNILEALGIEAANEFEQEYGPVAERAVNLMYKIVIRLLLLKYWQFSRHSIDLPDWKNEHKVTVFARDLPDAQYAKKIALLQEEWNKSQLRVPDGSLSPKAGLHILPLSNNSARGYTLYEPHSHVQSDASQYTGFPAVRFNEIRFDIIHDPNSMVDAEERLPNHYHNGEMFRWVQLRVLNATDRDMYLMWNKMTGEIECADNSSEDFAFRYSVVFPVNVNMIIPDTMGLKFEPQHWPILFRVTVELDAPVIVEDDLNKSLINQQSWFGPFKYLVTEGQFLKRDYHLIRLIKEGLKRKKVRDIKLVKDARKEWKKVVYMFEQVFDFIKGEKSEKITEKDKIIRIPEATESYVDDKVEQALQSAEALKQNEIIKRLRGR